MNESNKCRVYLSNGLTWIVEDTFKSTDSMFEGLTVQHFHSGTHVDSARYFNTVENKWECEINPHKYFTVTGFITNTGDGEQTFTSVSIKYNDITEFGIVNWRSRGKNFRFLKFHKSGYVRTDTGLTVKFASEMVATLKSMMKSDIKSTTKDTLVEAKYNAKGRWVGDRKATNWSYVVR